MTSEVYCSNGCEIFRHEDLDDAITDYVERNYSWKKGDTESNGFGCVLKGIKQAPLASDFFDSDSIIEQAQDKAFEDSVEDISEGWLDDVTREQLVELDKLVSKAINEWAEKKNHKPEWFNVINVEKICFSWSVGDGVISWELSNG